MAYIIILHAIVQVSMNGYVALENSYSSIYPPSKFPLTNNPNSDIVAPFWTDIDGRGSTSSTNTPGCVFYQTYYQYDTSYNSAPDVIKFVRADISKHTGQAFNVTFVMVVTWDRVSPYPQTANGNEVSYYYYAIELTSYFVCDSRYH